MLGALIAADPAHVSERRPGSPRSSSRSPVGACCPPRVLITDLVERREGDGVGDSLSRIRRPHLAGQQPLFSLLYWLLDSGGPLARYRMSGLPRLRFLQQLSPELAPPGWRPMYVDYFVLGITTSTAFSPTDVMPMVPWAKLTMTLQSLISLTVIALVIARAVNAFACWRWTTPGTRGSSSSPQSCSPRRPLRRPGARTSRRSGEASRR